MVLTEAVCQRISNFADSKPSTVVKFKLLNSNLKTPASHLSLKTLMFKTRFIQSFSNEFSNDLCLLYSIRG
jgi:hypothetical protein